MKFLILITIIGVTLKVSEATSHDAEPLVPNTLKPLLHMNVSRNDVKVIGLSTEVSTACANMITSSSPRKHEIKDSSALGSTMVELAICRLEALVRAGQVRDSEVLILRFGSISDEYLVLLLRNNIPETFSLETYYREYFDCSEKAIPKRSDEVEGTIFWNHLEHCLRSKLFPGENSSRSVDEAMKKFLKSSKESEDDDDDEEDDDDDENENEDEED